MPPTPWLSGEKNFISKFSEMPISAFWASKYLRKLTDTKRIFFKLTNKEKKFTEKLKENKHKVLLTALRFKNIVTSENYWEG